jgi:hypothetical protein
MPFAFYEVDAETKRLLDIGNDVIQKCRAIVAFGAGNQDDTIRDTGGWSSLLTGAVQNNPNYVWNQPLRNGAVTSAFSAGNCQDQGAVTYTILRSVLSKNEIAAFCVNNAIKHSFATIGDPERMQHDKVICVDPWPLKPQAVLLTHHFCRNGLKVITGKSRYAKPGGKNPDFMARLNKHAPDENLVRLWQQYVGGKTHDVEKIIAEGTGHIWHQVYCSKIEATIIYKVRPRWVPDSERPRCHVCKVQFTLTLRRHHCRACGEVFCDNCTKDREEVSVPATRPGSKPIVISDEKVRVCKPCKDQLLKDGFGG